MEFPLLMRTRKSESKPTRTSLRCASVISRHLPKTAKTLRLCCQLHRNWSGECSCQPRLGAPIGGAMSAMPMIHNFPHAPNSCLAYSCPCPPTLSCLVVILLATSEAEPGPCLEDLDDDFGAVHKPKGKGQRN